MSSQTLIMALDQCTTWVSPQESYQSRQYALRRSCSLVVGKVNYRGDVFRDGGIREGDDVACLALYAREGTRPSKDMSWHCSYRPTFCNFQDGK